ncbi:MAG: tryptophan-rich sensory protein [Deltaproteobacteria bacterium]|nr:tryptophan-rich sensory protein [Deltaproteobacteria bacterium]
MRFFLLVGFLLIGFIPSISSYFVTRNKEWYDGILKPFFTPPDYLFGIIWPFLFFILGLSGYLMWNTGDKRTRKIYTCLFLANTFLLSLWNFLFFELKTISGALLLLLFILVLALVLHTIIKKYFRSFSKLFLLYVCWIFFAFYLNLSILVLNYEHSF